MARILGLDIGSTSIGWALLEDRGDAGQILASGVRVFPEGVDRDQQGGEKSKSQSRREARGARRQHARRSRRKQKLIAYLMVVGLLPTDEDEFEQIVSMNPYPLRSRGLDEVLDAYGIGRVLMHLNQRRGFRSNRKTDKAKPSETKGMLAEINSLAARIDETECRTLGEYLHRIGKGEIDPVEGEPGTIRNRHTRRDMYEEEFTRLLDTQQAHHPDLLTEEVVERLHRLIFFQRDMYWPMSMVGACDLERRAKRCPVAERGTQRFRILQEVNNLKLIDRSTGEERCLSEKERGIVVAELAQSKQRTFDQIRKKLGFKAEVRFNLERDDGSGRSKLQGHITDATLASKGGLGKGYWKLDDTVKDRIVRILIQEDQEDRAITRLVGGCGLSYEDAERLCGLHLPDGYASYSKRAIKKLLPHLEAGMFVMGNDEKDSALHAAGYLRPDQRVVDQRDMLDAPPDLPNPIVRQALFEVRKVVNGVIREHCKDRTVSGEPPFDRIHVELAREAKNSFERRREVRFENAKRRKMRERAAEEIEQHGIKPTRNTINKYMLWDEQDRICTYSGRSISIKQMLSDATDIDHVLPRWRSLDNSMMNKVVVFREENKAKADRTPFEWLSASTERYDEVLLRAKKLPYPKYRRFIQKEVEQDQFVARQLKDTQYISRKVTEYLQCLGAMIVMPRGSITAELRRRWHLNNILSDDGEKTRADHRHHAVDAITIALINQGRIQRFARSRGEGELSPWNDLRDQADRSIQAINVSHRVQRRLSGSLHNDTLYGPTQKHIRKDVDDQSTPASLGQRVNRLHAKDWTEDIGTYVRRKTVGEIETAKHLAKVRDAAIRDTLRNHLLAQGIDPECKGKYPKGCFEGDNAPTMKSGVPINRVRMIENLSTVRPQSSRNSAPFVEPQNNHHVTYRETTDRKGNCIWIGEVTTTWDAAIRGRTKFNGKFLPLVDQSDNERGRFVMSLSIGELFEVDDPKDELRRILCTVRKIRGSDGLLYYKLHTDARRVTEIDPLNLYLSPKKMQKLNARKVTVTPVGEVRWAND